MIIGNDKAAFKQVIWNVIGWYVDIRMSGKKRKNGYYYDIYVYDGESGTKTIIKEKLHNIGLSKKYLRKGRWASLKYCKVLEEDIYNIVALAKMQGY